MESTRTLAFTDLVDSTSIHVRLGERQALELWREHDRASRDLLERWHGVEIDRSDGFLVMFEEPSHAASFIVDYHALLTHMSLPLTARAGIHTGPVQLVRNDPSQIQRGARPVEIVGLAKAICSRLMSTAAGGQTLVSTETAAALQPAGFVCHSHGFWRLKGLDEPLEVFELDRQDAPCLGSPAAAEKGYRVVCAGDGQWRSLTDVPRHLPSEVDRFFGRREDALLLAQMVREHRLVSILGPGGVGKTRLALRHAWGWMGDFPGGAYFCDLLAASGIDGIALAVARALEVPLGAEPIAQLGTVISARGRCLVILDNFEHLTAHAAPTLGVWLSAAPEARFVITSRERLALPAERGLALEPLQSRDAIALFHERAKAAHSAYTPESPADVMEQLVCLLDRLPLAIELAAARVAVVPPAGLLKLMNERFRLLSSIHGRPDRQATLYATLEWSWDLLSLPERLALAQLSVFVGSLTTAAANATIDMSVVGSDVWVVDVLQMLVDKSLLRSLGGERFVLLQCIRDFAAEKLAGGSAAPAFGPMAVVAAGRRHHRHFACLSEEQAVTNGCVELDNLIAACRGACTSGDAQEAVDCLRLSWLALRRVGPFRAAVDLASAVERLPLQPAERACVEWVRGAALYIAGETSDAQLALEHGMAIVPADADRKLLARLNCSLGEILSVRGKPAQAHAFLQAADEWARASGDIAVLCQVLNAQGALAADEARVEEARRLYSEALDAAEQAGDQRWQAGVLGNLGVLMMTAARYDEAIVASERALGCARAGGDLRWAGNAHCNLGLIHYEQDRLAEAEAHLEQALDAASRLGDRMLRYIAMCNLGLVSEKRGDLWRARERHQAAVDGAASVGDVRMEAQMRACLGSVLGRISLHDEARDCLSTARKLLGSTQDYFSRGLVMCSTAENEWLAGHREHAHGALADAEQMLQAFGGDAKSELGRRVAAIQRLLGT